MARQTPSQTVGPYFAYGLAPEQYGYGLSLTSIAGSRIAPDDTVVVVHTAPADDGSTTTGMPAGYTIAAPDLASFAAAWQGLTDGAP